MALDDFMRPMVSKFTSRGVGKRFSEAAQLPGSGIEIVESDGHGHTQEYRITINPQPW